MILKTISSFLQTYPTEAAEKSPGPVTAFMTTVAIVIAVLCVLALIVGICLSACYAKYDRRKNIAGMTGRAIARQVLDTHGMQRPKVVASNSVLLGNSYSNLFKKVRLRRKFADADSVAALAAAVQTSCLAILDSQGDETVTSRRQATPLICLGTWGMIPLILVGALLNAVVPFGKGWWIMSFTILAIFLFLLALFLALKGLRAELKAQSMALPLLVSDDLASSDEVTQCSKLFRLRNIAYINNMFLALLELIYFVLQILIRPRPIGSTTDGT